MTHARIRWLVMTLLVAGSAAWATAEAGSRTAPPGPYVQRDVCPFECCVYGTWVARRPLVVHPQERDTTRIAFSIVAGDSFQSLTGNVHVLRLGEARVRHPFTLRGETDSLRVVPGDRLDIVDYYQEGGGARVWCRGGYYDVDGETWNAPESMGRGKGDPLVRLLHDLVSEWWVRVRARDGREGWLRMNDDPYEPLEVDGADLCG